MARVSGVDIPREKRVEVALTYVFGIGRTLSQETLAATGVDPNTRVRDLSEEQLVAIREYVDANIKTEGDLRREIQADIRRKVEIGCYQGLRHRRGLPVRGQRTSTNARTRKGPRRAIMRQEEAGQEVVRSGQRFISGLRCRTDHLPVGVIDAPKGRQGAAKKVRRKEKKNVAHGQAHIKSTFNNTIVSITDPAGNVISWASMRPRRLQGLAQVHAVRRADGRRVGCPSRAGARHAQGRRLRQGPGRRS